MYYDRKNKTYGFAGTKFKAHPSFSPTKQQQCVLPHIVHCFQLYSVSTESTINLIGGDKKNNPLQFWCYNRHSSTFPSLSHMCKNCAESFGPSSNEEHEYQHIPLEVIVISL